ncbi:MAG: hypothetical protein COX29_04585 [Candidatus Moranbacteria bacterium CG23_combo_of_CG06-09_8_20_14_all_35_22]|nr:MAG: hypothetical protein COX29_04585 [Candidatus Moranbacteria bacterium CG23_combo_of_CG06-09_8_20_14_all_35_22]
MKRILTIITIKKMLVIIALTGLALVLASLVLVLVSCCLYAIYFWPVQFSVAFIALWLGAIFVYESYWSKRPDR